MWNSSSKLALTLTWGPKSGENSMPSLGFNGSVKSDFRVHIFEEKRLSQWKNFFLCLHTPVFLLGVRLLLPKETSLNKHTLLVGIDKGRWSKQSSCRPPPLLGPAASPTGARELLPTARERTTLEKRGIRFSPQSLYRPPLALCSLGGPHGVCLALCMTQLHPRK